MIIHVFNGARQGEADVDRLADAARVAAVVAVVAMVVALLVLPRRSAAVETAASSAKPATVGD